MKFCECGCGEPAPIATMTSRKRGVVKGQPQRFVAGHVHRSRRARYIVDEAGCWIWQRNRNNKGYGTDWDPTLRRARLAHVMAFEAAVGPVPDGMELDHLCGNPACVNPDHLEAVSHVENVRRGRHVRLDAEKVAEIRARGAQGESKARLAAEFGVSPVHVRALCRGEKWKGVTAAAQPSLWR